MARVVAIIQARTGSSRLPGKVLMPILGTPMLARVVERTRRARLVDEVVVATTTLAADDRIATLATASEWPLERGSEDDLLDRYLQAARRHRADAVVRITSDCPLVDPELIDQVVAAYRERAVDYAANTLEPRTFPRGLDVEVVSFAALERAWTDDADPRWREHATPYVYNHPELFRLRRVAHVEDLSHHRWCVDTAEDLELVRRIYAALGRSLFGWREALAVVEANPGWSDLNRHVVQKTVPSEGR